MVRIMPKIMLVKLLESKAFYKGKKKSHSGKLNASDVSGLLGEA
jgi:CBS domain-containing protein